MKILSVIAVLFNRAVATLEQEQPPLKRVRVGESLDAIESLHHQSFTAVAERYGSNFSEAIQTRMRHERLAGWFAPKPDTNDSQVTPQGNLQLEEIITKGIDFVIYSVKDRHDILIKFQANCLEEAGGPNVHQLLVESWFGTAAARRGLAPATHFVSPPSALCARKEGKCAFTMDEESFMECREKKNVSLRYMVMERVTGVNFKEIKRMYHRGIVPFATAVTLGYDLIRVIQALHEESDVVHGSISLENVAWKKSGSWPINLINFGRSFEKSAPRRNERMHRFCGNIHARSVWEYEGYLSAPRDDIARAVLVIAELMQPWNLRKEAFAFDSAFNPLSDGTLVNPVDALNITQEYKTLIHERFRELSDLVNNMTDINAVPPYEQILHCLSEVHNIYNVAGNFYNYTLVAEKYGSYFAERLHVWRDDDKITIRPDRENNQTLITPVGRLELEETAWKGEDSVMYTVQGRTDILIKFIANCNQAPGDVHPGLIDSWFGSLAAEHSIGPGIIFVSPPSQLCENKLGRCAFDMDDAAYAQCKARPNAALRYLILQRTPSLTLEGLKHRSPNGVVPFSLAMRIGFNMIKQLYFLHQFAHVVHGNLDLNTVSISSLNGTHRSVEIQLLDFSRATRYAERPSMPGRNVQWVYNEDLGAYVIKGPYNPSSSAWELEGYASAARDDIERAVSAIAELLLPRLMGSTFRITGALGSLEGSPLRVVPFKQSASFFGPFDAKHENFKNPVDQLVIPNRYKLRIKTALEQIMNLVRGMTEVNSVPPYAKILTQLKHILDQYHEGLRDMTQ